MTQSTFEQIAQTHPDLLSIIAHKTNLIGKIERGESINDLESNIISIEQVFGEELSNLREQTAIDKYNTDPNNSQNFQINSFYGIKGRIKPG